MEEFPISVIPDEPFWSENFALAVHDPAASVDIFLHIGRWRRDPTLWRELVTVGLPDGTVIAHRGIGASRADATSPGGPLYSIEIIEPGRHLRYRFLGGARRVPGNILATGLLPDGPMERVEIVLDFHGVAPIWDISAVGLATDYMGRGHIEQLGRIAGHVRVGDAHWAIDSIGNRDHSRGVRVNDSMIRHIWMHGIFEDGRAFLCYEGEVPGRDDPAYSEACVLVSDRLMPARLELHDRLPFEGALTHIETPVRFDIVWAGGRIEAQATFAATIHYQYTYPNDLYIGRRQIDMETNRSWIEQPMMLTCTLGGKGYGHMERTVPGKLIADPL